MLFQYRYNLLLIIYIELTRTLNLCKRLRINLCKFKGIIKYLVWNIRVITCNNNLSIHIHVKIQNCLHMYLLYAC